MNGIYCGLPPLPKEIWTSWNLDGWLLASLVVLAVLLRRDRAGLAAVFVLSVAFISPLCALSSALFSARAVHHVLLVAVAAPLLSLVLRRRTGMSLAPPFVVSTVTLWLWHLPGAYDLALSNIPVYWIMQLTLLGSATWFWHTVLAGQASPVERFAYIVASFAQMGMLGAILTLMPQPVYAAHSTAPFLWGLTPLEDQQLAGLVMWVPAGLPYAVAAVFLARRSWANLKDGVA
ncbi:cytochrome c oxidase assembly protein [Henriciella sp.]|uniref:cytochrome c oxidase assembly protein n=1 Tax=Henriciella sp. TaxID=1968823 RepID=UPI00261884F1|nr:cytochrome c oxidase assembly protein [Henriciella sp.]